MLADFDREVIALVAHPFQLAGPDALQSGVAALGRCTRAPTEHTANHP
jgi:hypothetical protein